MKESVVRLNTPPAFEGVGKAVVFLGVGIGIPFLGVTYRGKLLRFGLCKERLDFFPIMHPFEKRRCCQLLK